MWGHKINTKRVQIKTMQIIKVERANVKKDIAHSHSDLTLSIDILTAIMQKIPIILTNTVSIL